MISEQDSHESNRSPTEELESVTRGIKAIVDLMFKTLDDRLGSVATAFADILHQRIETIRSEETVFQEAWATQPLTASPYFGQFLRATFCNTPASP
jgi:hypothetical protein